MAEAQDRLVNDQSDTSSAPLVTTAENPTFHQYQREHKDIIEVLNGCLICCLANGRIKHLNNTFLKLSGWQREDQVGHAIQNLIASEDVGIFLKAFADTAQSGKVTRLDLKFKKKDDGDIDMAVSIVPDSSKEILIIGWDITERKEVERFGRLRLEQTKIDSQLKAFKMLEDIPDGFFSVDKNWHLLYLNKEAQRIARKDNRDIVGQHLWKAYPELIGTTIYQKYTEAMNTGKPCRFEEYLPEFNAWFETNLYPSEDGLVVYFRDTTDRKRAQEQLKRYAEELERSNTDLEQYAYIASHDLQEPLRMISSFVNLLGEENANVLTENSKKYIQFAQDGAERMRTLIRDLLEYSRVSSTELSYQMIDTNQIVDFAILNLKQTIEEKHAEIIVTDLAPIQGAHSQFVLLFQTLISNALKFHRDIPPRIQIESKPHEEGDLFTISDNGIGIPPQHLTSIFKIFKRLHCRSSYIGTGIGLAIAKKIVERYGGKIWVISRVGEGSTFYFYLPRRDVKKNLQI
jgi:PAS domain S-box-containing protein